MKTARTVDAYLARLGDEPREALERLRALIRAAAPGAVECISYGIPAFRHAGRMLVWFGAAKHHCSFFPGAIVADFADDLAGFETSKGTIRFTPGHPLPATLVRRVVKACIARNDARERGKPSARAARKAAPRGRRAGAGRAGR